MSNSFDNFQKRRLISSYFSVTLSITLVLFLLGILGLFILNAKKVENHFKEQISLTIFLKDSAKKVEIKQLEKSLKMADYIKSIDFVSKEHAAEQMKETNGEDFMSFLGFNPLKNSLDIKLKADYVNQTQLENITNKALSKKFVDEVTYDEDLVVLMNKNVKKITLWLLIISALFMLIVVLLINSSIRLSVYSNRFTIKTMQMVGATKRFIRQPFIIKNIKLGVLGAIIALIGIVIVIFYLNKTFKELDLLASPLLLGVLLIGIMLIGIIITWLSTFFATQRYLNLKTDQLY